MEKFKVIKGGLSRSADNEKNPVYEFITGEVTDSRLMGIIGLHIYWEKHPEEIPLHQIFYFDAEELGLDHICILQGKDEALMLSQKLRESFGGLGCGFAEINEKEARYLVSYFEKETRRLGQLLPPEFSQLGFVLAGASELSPEELDALNKKTCTEIKTPFGIINYFLMRALGKDDAYKLLVSPSAKKEDIDAKFFSKHATFLLNNIELFNNEASASEKDPAGSAVKLRGKKEHPDKRTAAFNSSDENKNISASDKIIKNPDSVNYCNKNDFSYLCESIAESESRHYLIVSEIRLSEDGLVSLCRLKNKFQISAPEASTRLNRNEYVTVYQASQDVDEFELFLDSYLTGSTKTNHPAGLLYMRFRTENSHVENKLYRLNDDVKAMYFLTDIGQLIVGAYSEKDIGDIENELFDLPAENMLIPLKRMAFDESLLYDFAEGDFDNFFDYLSSLM